MERPESIDVRKSSELKFISKIKQNKASFQNREVSRESFKLPRIQTLKNRFEEQESIAEQVAGTPERSPTLRKTEDENQEGLLVKSIIKRRDWIKKYKISEKILFDLFSEFTSIMMLAKAKEHKDNA